MILVGKNKLGHNVYRGKRPKSHSILEDAGIKYRIDLQSGMFEDINSDVLEMEKESEFGVQVIDYDLGIVFPPSREEIQNILHDIETSDGPVYVHCMHGKDRTGFVCAAWHISKGVSFSDAVDDMFNNGFHVLPYVWWLWFLKKCT